MLEKLYEYLNKYARFIDKIKKIDILIYIILGPCLTLLFPAHYYHSFYPPPIYISRVIKYRKFIFDHFVEFLLSLEFYFDKTKKIYNMLERHFLIFLQKQ